MSRRTSSSMASQSGTLFSACIMLSVGVTLVIVLITQWGRAATKVQEAEHMEMRVRARLNKVKETKFAIEMFKHQLEAQREEVGALLHELYTINSRQRETALEAKTCQDAMTEITRMSAAVEQEMTDGSAHFSALKADWIAEIHALKEELVSRSKVCDFVKKDSKGAKLCL